METPVTAVCKINKKTNHPRASRHRQAQTEPQSQHGRGDLLMRQGPAFKTGDVEELIKEWTPN